MPTNREIITHIYAETAKGNGQPFVDALADSATWRAIGTNSWGRAYVGKETIINELFRPLRRRLEVMRTVAHRVVDAGDTIIVQARGKNITREGQPYENDYCFVIQLKDGKIVMFEEYCDTELVTAVLGERV